MQFDFEQIMTDVEYLIRQYSNTKRNAVQPFIHETYKKHNPDYVYKPQDDVVRESVLEHVGMLPVLAVYFHPYCEKTVDLGKALRLLAIHDIGELVTGDESVFTKDYQNNQNEVSAALSLLHDSFHDDYLEFENLGSNEAKFAKSIDKMVGDFYDIFSDPQMTKDRYDYFVKKDISKMAEMKLSKKYKYMEWSEFFTDFYPLLMGRFDDTVKHLY